MSYRLSPTLLVHYLRGQIPLDRAVEMGKEYIEWDQRRSPAFTLKAPFPSPPSPGMHAAQRRQLGGEQSGGSMNTRGNEPRTN